MTLNRGESTHMPYDDIDPTDLARMQAAVDFNRYDDGASQLQRSPFMQQVGLFGKAKPKPVVTPNLSRRTMGLNIPTQMPDQLPAVIDPLAKLPPGGPIAAQPSALPQAPAPAQPVAEPVNPLTALAKMPMSRRKFMEIPANAAVSHLGKQIMGPITPASVSTPSPVEAVIPKFSSNDIANKTGEYVASVMANPKFATAYHDLLQNSGLVDEEDMARYTEFLENKQPNAMYQDFGQFDDLPEESLAGFAEQFSLNHLAKETGIPIKEFEKRGFTDADLHELLSSIGQMHNYQESIIEDGRAKEAVRSTVIEDLNYKKAVKSAIKELGKDADYEELINLANEKLQSEYFAKTKSSQGSTFFDKVYGAGLMKYSMPQLKEVYNQAFDEWILPEIEGQLNDILDTD